MTTTNDFSDVAAAADSLARTYSQRAAATTAAQAAAMSNIADAWPTLDPGLVLPLGQAGLGGDHPVVQQAAAQAVKQKAHKGLLSRIGSDVYGVTVRPARAAAGVVARNVVDPVKSVVPKPVANVFGDVMAPVKGLTRMSFDVLNVAPQLLQAGFRDATQGQFDAAHFGSELAQTNLGQYIGQGLTHGGHVDTGSGFFDNLHSKVGQGQSSAARAAAPLINGHATTVGRYIAAKVTEPGTTPYSVLSGLLDAGVALTGGKGTSGGDAARGTEALGGRAQEVTLGADGVLRPATAGRATQAVTPATVAAVGSKAVSYGVDGSGNVSRLGAGYGLVNGLRKTVLPERAVTWMNSAAGNKFADFAANTSDFNTLWQVTGKQLPVVLVHQLTKATSPLEAKQILTSSLTQGGTTAPVLGGFLRTAPDVPAGAATAATGGTPSVIARAGLTVQRVKQQSALLQNMPGTHLSLSDPDAAVKSLDTFQRIGKLDEATISANNAKLAAAFATGQGGAVENAVSHVMDVVAQTLEAHGVRAPIAHQVTRLWQNTTSDLRHYNVNDIGQNARFPGVDIGDNGLPVPSPHMAVEYLNNFIPLPSARALREASSKLAAITQSVPGELVGNAADVLTQDLFKPLTLLRAAWPLRVVGEEQFRIGAAGYASAVNHPLQFIAMLLHNPNSATAKLLAKAGKANLSTDALGQAFRDQGEAALAQDANDYARAMSRRGAGYIDPSNGIITRHFPLYTKGVDPGYNMAWAHELTMLNRDPVASRIAKAFTDAGPDAEAIPTAMAAIKDWFWNGAGAGLRANLAKVYDSDSSKQFAFRSNPFTDRAQADQWVDSIAQRIMTKTAGHPQLMDAVASGRVMGHDLTSGLDINRNAADALEQFRDYGPQKVTGPLRVYGNAGRQSAANQVGARYRQATSWLFDQLMSKPSNALSRSPVFRQAYWQRMQELAPHLDQPSATKAAAAADVAGTTKAAQAIRADGGTGNLALEDADTLAKRHGLNETQNLLYGASKKSNFFDAFRVIAPFGDAWREVLTRWAKLSAQNPNVLLRAGQILNEAHESGFLHVDPQTGQEVFTYPGSQMLTQLLTGVPAPLTAPGQGLNMVSSQMLPGFGPAVSIPVGMLSPNIPGVSEVQKIVIPFGPGDTSGGGLSNIAENLMPAWLRKMQASGYLSTVGISPTPQQKRQLISTTNDVAAYLYSTGKYDISTPTGQQKLLADAQAKARQIWVIRGMAQFAAPSTPTPQAMARDKDGRLTTLYALQTAYRDLQTKDPTNATADFLKQYGDLALMATNPKTTATFSPTSSLYDFAQANPGLVKKYPTLYGYFAPAGGVFSNPEYQKQLSSGERTAISAQQNLDITNQRMATAIYNEAKAEVAGRTDSAASAWLTQVRDALTQKYPQFAASTPDVGTTAAQINRLEIAVQDPQVLSTEAGKALAVYMQARAQALTAAKSAGYVTFASAKDLANVRAWLRQVGAALSTKYPDFAPLYSKVLAHEMTANDTGATK